MNLNADTLNCGVCGRNCSSAPHVTGATCQAGQCAVTACEANWSDCNHDGNDGCETPLLTNANCRFCGNACTGSYLGLPYICNAQVRQCCAAGTSQCKSTSGF